MTPKTSVTESSLQAFAHAVPSAWLLFPHNLLVNLDQSHRVFKTLVNVTAYSGYSLAQLLKDFNVCAFLGHFSWVADRRAFPLRLTNPRRPEESLISAFGSEAQLAGDEWKGF